MRAVVQRVSHASVAVQDKPVASIGRGFLVLLGIGVRDGAADADYIADKVVNLRVFEDEAGKLNLSLLDIAGEALVVSQFTLYGDCRKGRRPSFTESASGDVARALYDSAANKISKLGVRVQTGMFGAMMDVSLTNDGPVTILLDSSREF